MTIKDIAERCGVSVSTVSRVLNNHPDVSAANRERVMAVVESSHYVPNNSARDLVKPQSDTIGLVVRGVEIRGIDDLEQFIIENEVQIAALTIPKSKAPEIAERLVNAGIKAIWNFAHMDLTVPDDVVVENVHLSDSLMRLSYRVSSMMDERERKEKERLEKEV